jgi:hypothetical protein
MPWQEVAGGRRRYLYRSQRVNSRPVRQYVGRGPIAEMQATLDGLQRLGREIAAREYQAEQARRRLAEAPLLDLCDLTDVLTRATLVAAGYHQHDQGAWRRRRGHASRAQPRQV